MKLSGCSVGLCMYRNIQHLTVHYNVHYNVLDNILYVTMYCTMQCKVHYNVLYNTVNVKYNVLYTTMYSTIQCTAKYNVKYITMYCTLHCILPSTATIIPQPCGLVVAMFSSRQQYLLCHGFFRSRHLSRICVSKSRICLESVVLHTYLCSNICLFQIVYMGKHYLTLIFNI